MGLLCLFCNKFTPTFSEEAFLLLLFSVPESCQLMADVDSRKVLCRIRIKHTKSIYFVHLVVNLTLIGQNTQRDDAT